MKSLKEKELEQLILQFFNENRAVNFATIANKIGLRRSAKSEKEIPVKFMFPLIQQIAKYGFAIGDYEFWTMKNEDEIIALYAIKYDLPHISYIEIKSLDDIYEHLLHSV